MSRLIFIKQLNTRSSPTCRSVNITLYSIDNLRRNVFVIKASACLNLIKLCLDKCYAFFSLLRMIVSNTQRAT